MAAVGIVQKEDKTRESFARISLASKLELISQLWQGEIGLQCSNVTSVVEFEWAGPTVCMCKPCYGNIPLYSKLSLP